jgi:hypothetical protein
VAKVLKQRRKRYPAVLEKTYTLSFVARSRQHRMCSSKSLLGERTHCELFDDWALSSLVAYYGVELANCLVLINARR